MSNLKGVYIFRSPLFALGFRPFFLLGPLYVVLITTYWIGYHLGWWSPPSHWEPTLWHAHEMIFGFVVAILSGFLLTASRNWANTRGVHGLSLLILVATWTLGRICTAASSALPALLVTVIDLAYIPLLSFFLLQTLLKGARRANLVFVLWLLILFIANLLMHLEALGSGSFGRTGLLLAVDTIVVIMTLMGGRVIPMFTQNAVPGLLLKRNKYVEWGALVGTVLYLLGDGFLEGTSLTCAIAVIAGALNLARLWTWQPLKTIGRPILWILHVGYLFICLGLFARGLFPTMAWRSSLALHFLTAGAMGSLIIGMISRVALGHTGRPLLASKSVVSAYWFVIIGALGRIVAPLFLPNDYSKVIGISGFIWTIGFAIYFAAYWPILTQPRVDGKEG